MFHFPFPPLSLAVDSLGLNMFLVETKYLLLKFLVASFFSKFYSKIELLESHSCYIQYMTWSAVFKSFKV